MQGRRWRHEKAELDRSAELFEEILTNQDIYLALMFLLDSSYGREEIRAIADRLKPKQERPKVAHGANCFAPLVSVARMIKNFTL